MGPACRWLTPRDFLASRRGRTRRNNLRTSGNSEITNPAYVLLAFQRNCGLEIQLHVDSMEMSKRCRGRGHGVVRSYSLIPCSSSPPEGVPFGSFPRTRLARRPHLCLIDNLCLSLLADNMGNVRAVSRSRTRVFFLTAGLHRLPTSIPGTFQEPPGRQPGMLAAGKWNFSSL